MGPRTLRTAGCVKPRCSRRQSTCRSRSSRPTQIWSSLQGGTLLRSRCLRRRTWRQLGAIVFRLGTARDGLLALGALLLCGAGAPPAAPASGSLPAWLLGTWSPVDIRENNGIRYIPNDGPKQWYKDSELMVTSDRLAFHDDACVVGSVQTKHGPVSTPMKAKAGGVLRISTCLASASRCSILRSSALRAS